MSKKLAAIATAGLLSLAACQELDTNSAVSFDYPELLENCAELGQIREATRADIYWAILERYKFDLVAEAENFEPEITVDNPNYELGTNEYFLLQLLVFNGLMSQVEADSIDDLEDNLTRAEAAEFLIRTANQFGILYYSGPPPVFPDVNAGNGNVTGDQQDFITTGLVDNVFIGDSHVGATAQAWQEDHFTAERARFHPTAEICLPDANSWVANYTGYTTSQNILRLRPRPGSGPVFSADEEAQRSRFLTSSISGLCRHDYNPPLAHSDFVEIPTDACHNLACVPATTTVNPARLAEFSVTSFASDCTRPGTWHAEIDGCLAAGGAPILYNGELNGFGECVGIDYD